MTALKKTLALFDFDGTITTEDTLNAFVIYTFGSLAFYFFVFTHLPRFILYWLRLSSNTAIKELIARVFLQNIPYAGYEDWVETFAAKRIPDLVRPEALRRIAYHRQRGHEIVIISASPKEWIEGWAKVNGISHVIASTLQVSSQKLTGKFTTNVHGKEKVHAFTQAYPSYKNYELFAYGDSRDDRPLLSLAQHQFYRKFE